MKGGPLGKGKTKYLALKVLISDKKEQKYNTHRIRECCINQSTDIPLLRIYSYVALIAFTF